jgi:hypothetical protein
MVATLRQNAFGTWIVAAFVVLGALAMLWK